MTIAAHTTPLCTLVGAGPGDPELLTLKALKAIESASVLLVDEPFVGLDAAGRSAMLELLGESVDNGASVIVATHDPDVIDRFDRGVVLENGELVHDGPADSVRAFLTVDDQRG